MEIKQFRRVEHTKNNAYYIWHMIPLCEVLKQAKVLQRTKVRIVVPFGGYQLEKGQDRTLRVQKK